MGKHRPTYTPHIDTGDYVIVTNVDKVVFTGNKWTQKSYQRYSGYPGGQRDEAAWKLFERQPEQILQLAIQRMMPKNKIGVHMMSKLKLYVGPNHPHQAQCPIPLEAMSGRPTPAGAVFVVPPGSMKEGAGADAATTEPAAPARRRLMNTPQTGARSTGSSSRSTGPRLLTDLPADGPRANFQRGKERDMAATTQNPFTWGTGRRKTAVARVRIREGTGKFWSTARITTCISRWKSSRWT